MFRSAVRTYQRDGPMTVNGNQGGAPNYYPNSFAGAKDDKKFAWHQDTVSSSSSYDQLDM